MLSAVFLLQLGWEGWSWDTAPEGRGETGPLDLLRRVHQSEQVSPLAGCFEDQGDSRTFAVDGHIF